MAPPSLFSLERLPVVSDAKQEIVDYPRPSRTQVVDPEVSRAKLRRELDEWHAAERLHRGRGIQLAAVDDLWVEVMFITNVQLPFGPRVPVITAYVGLDFTNYDVEPLSVTFLDPWSRQPGSPWNPPIEFDGVTGAAQSLVPGNHPITNRPYLCVPGVWEYHSHIQHSDDPWATQHRQIGRGRLSSICDRIWATTSRHFVLAPQLAIIPARDAAAIQQEATAQNELPIAQGSNLNGGGH